eukprot:4434527-Amphidinium_carterae.1
MKTNGCTSYLPIPSKATLFGILNQDDFEVKGHEAVRSNVVELGHHWFSRSHHSGGNSSGVCSGERVRDCLQRGVHVTIVADVSDVAPRIFDGVCATSSHCKTKQ